MFLKNPIFTIHLFTLDYEKTVFDLHTQLEGEDGVVCVSTRPRAGLLH